MDYDSAGTVPVRVNYVLRGEDGTPLMNKGVPLTVGGALCMAAGAPAVNGNGYTPESNMERWQFMRRMTDFQKTSTKRNAIFPIEKQFMMELAQDLSRFPVTVAGQTLTLIERWANPPPAPATPAPEPDEP